MAVLVDQQDIGVFPADVRGLLLDLHREDRLQAGVDIDLLAGLVIPGVTSVAPHVVSGWLTAAEACSPLLGLLPHRALPRRPS